MSTAITANLVLVTRVATFYPLSSEARQDIVREVAKTMEDLGKKHNFLVWRVSLDTKGEINETNEQV